MNTTETKPFAVTVLFEDAVAPVDYVVEAKSWREAMRLALSKWDTKAHAAIRSITVGR